MATLTKEEQARIEAEAEKLAMATTLATADDLQAAVDSWVTTLSGGAKRRSTLLAVAAGEVNGQSRNEIFSRKDVVNIRTFYHADKGYFNDPEFRLALEVVTRLYRRWEALETTRFLAERQAAFREKTFKTADKMLERAQEMLEFPLRRTEKSEDGQTVIIQPAAWNLGNVPGLVTTADKVGRLALGMEGERAAVDLTWAEALPDGITVEEAEEAKRQFAKLLAAQSLRAADEGDEDSE
jgi:hypothetical protein